MVQDAQADRQPAAMSAGGYARAAIERVFREESGRIMATLVRVLGSFDLAEESLQDALAEALAHWPSDGVPDRPGAWLTVAARRKAIDRLRHDRTGRLKLASSVMPGAPEAGNVGEDEFDRLERDLLTTVEDDQLLLIFTCCHPALGRDAQVALTLRTLCGLTTREIARAFLLPEETLAQRIVRAKRKIRAAGIPYARPSADELPERLPGVLTTVYLVFNEGYSAGSGDALIRHELCAEALRLGRLLAGLMPEEPETGGLLSLMLLHDSRRHTRHTSDGRLVLLEDQDRSLWDRAEIAEGIAVIERSLRAGRPGPYQLQAAIAAVHAEAPDAGDTDWQQIALLYAELRRIDPSPVVELNRAVAVAMASGPKAGLKIVDRLVAEGELAGYRWLHSTRADLLRKLGRPEEACDEYRKALDLSGNAAERQFLCERIEALSAGAGG